MQYVKIKNAGEIDVRAFSMIGASSKRKDDTKIGFFGSGNKYAIACLLRKEIPFKVFSGLNEITFAVRNENFRNVDIKQIYINGEKTSLTTDMGIDWETWFIIRETFCNAIDEGNESIEIVDAVGSPENGITAFYIGINQDIQFVLTNWNNYFSDKREDLVYYDNDLNKVFLGDGNNTIIYRKGIQCSFSESLKSIFHYDMSWIEINESRVIKEDWTFKWELRRWLQELTDVNTIDRLLSALNKKNKFLEFSLYWNSEYANFSDSWLTAIKERYLVVYESAGLFDEEIKLYPCLVLPNSLVEGLRDRFGDQVKVMGEGSKGKTQIKIVAALSDRQTYLLADVNKFFEETKYDIKYPIKVCKFSDDNILGQAKDETIYVSEKVFELGRRQLAETIIEEQEHLVSGFDDESRAFQNHFIQKFISEKEERFGYFL